MKITAKECEITTERLFLRPVQEEDVDLFWPYVSNPELPKFMSWEAHTKKQETINFINNKLKSFNEGTSILWCIFYEDTFCGAISFEGVLREVRALRFDSAEIGYWLGKEFRGNGFMTEACKALIKFGFQKYNLHKINIGHFSKNQSSKRVIEKMGFRFLGEQKDYCYKNGKWHDHKIYEMLESECSFL